MLLCLSSKTEAQSNCRLRKDEDSIRVYTCHTDSSKFKSIVAEFTLHTTITQLRDFMLDFPNYKSWQYNTVLSRSITKINELEFIYYTEIEAPWPVTDRDMVVRLSMQQTATQLIIAANSVKGKMALQKGFVRVPSSHSQWIISKVSDDKLQVKYEMQIDPGGAVPVWLANWVCAQGPYLSFKRLKEQLEKKK